MTYSGDTNIIVIRYTPSSVPRYVKIAEGSYKEITDPAEATTFHKKKDARAWISENVLHKQFMTVEDKRFHLKPLKGS